jgi:uncharacterized membrane protein YGL010W
MRTIDHLLNQYGESHQNATNKLIHWVCVPAIMFSLLGLVMCIPFPVEKSLFANWTAVFLALALAYYLRLSVAMFAGFIIIGGLMLLGNWALYTALDFNTASMAIWSLAIFAVAWVGQFYGHKIEGKKPSFLKDVQFLLIGPAWLMHFIYKRVGLKY